MDETGEVPQIIIGYGCGDRMSRTLSMSLEDFEKRFFGRRKRMWLPEDELEVLQFADPWRQKKD